MAQWGTRYLGDLSSTGVMLQTHAVFGLINGINSKNVGGRNWRAHTSN